MILVKKIFLMLILIHNLNLLAADDLIFYEADKPHSFEFNKKDFLIISKDCQKKCLAYQSLSKIQKLDLARDGGANPGAIICIEQLKSKTVVMKDKDGDENGFCEFEDKSLIALGSLHRAWRDLAPLNQ